MSKEDDTKADRKISAAAVGDEKAYEDTEFGRRRVSKWPKAFTVLLRLIVTSFLFIYRRLRGGASEAQSYAPTTRSRARLFSLIEISIR